MSVVLVGISHRTAPVELREQLAFGDAVLLEALKELVDRETITEGLIISTCNRVEILATTSKHAMDGITQLHEFLERRHGCRPEMFERHFYSFTDLEAIIDSKPLPAADPPITYAIVDKARSLLGFQPHTSLEVGLDRFWAWYQAEVLGK